MNAFIGPRNGNFTSEDVYAFTTTVHPYAIYIHGRDTFVSLAYVIHTLCGNGNDFMIWDGATCGLPLAVFCARSEDRDSLTDILNENTVRHELIG